LYNKNRQNAFNPEPVISQTSLTTDNRKGLSLHLLIYLRHQ